MRKRILSLISIIFWVCSIQSQTDTGFIICMQNNETGLITAKIQHAIDSCASAGGGVVRFPEGRYLSGGLKLKSNVTLQFDKGAVLQGSDNYLDYGKGEWKNGLITGDSLFNISIEGEGLIDGASCNNPHGEEGFRGPGEYEHRISRRTNMLAAFVHFSPEDENPMELSGNWLIQDITISNVDCVYNYNYENGLWQTGQPVTTLVFENIKAASSAFFNARNFDILELHHVTFHHNGKIPVLYCISGNKVWLDQVNYLPASELPPYKLENIGTYVEF